MSFTITLEKETHVSLIRWEFLACLARKARFARLVVRSSWMNILYSCPFWSVYGFDFNFFLASITSVLVRLLANLMSMARGFFSLRAGASSAFSPVPSFWAAEPGGGLPTRWVTSRSSSVSLGVTFTLSFRIDSTLLSVVPGVDSGTPNILIDPLRPCCSISSHFICSSCIWHPRHWCPSPTAQQFRGESDTFELSAPYTDMFSHMQWWFTSSHITSHHITWHHITCHITWLPMLCCFTMKIMRPVSIWCRVLF